MGLVRRWLHRNLVWPALTPNDLVAVEQVSERAYLERPGAGTPQPLGATTASGRTGRDPGNRQGRDRRDAAGSSGRRLALLQAATEPGIDAALTQVSGGDDWCRPNGSTSCSRRRS